MFDFVFSGRLLILLNIYHIEINTLTTHKFIALSTI